MKDSYVLITPAKNEGRYIEETIRSVLGQTLLPRRWVIVDDGSTDQTGVILEKYARAHAFIQPVSFHETADRSFRSKAHAFNAGYLQARDVPCDFMGNLDADITLEEDYFESLLMRFAAHPDVGLAGGYIHEESGGVFRSRTFNRPHSVAGAVQMFRRECLDRLGGYVPMPYGGIDWGAEIMVRMHGWRVRAFPELRVFHHKPTGSAGGSRLRMRFLDGRKAFTAGSLPSFELIKAVSRFKDRPPLIGAVTRLLGFAWCYCDNTPRALSPSVVQHHRQEQRKRIRALVSQFPRRGHTLAADPTCKGGNVSI